MESFNTHKWFKKQYLEEDNSDNDKVVAATKDGKIEITAKQMKRLHNGEVVRLSNGSVLSFVKEGMSDKEFRDAQEADALEKHPEKDTIKAIQAMLAKEREIQANKMGNKSLKEDDLKENMSKGEAVVELNSYMNDLEDISAAVSRIMQQTFPGEHRRGEAYGAFDFGSSRNQFDITFESILDSLASEGDEME